MLFIGWALALPSSMLIVTEKLSLLGVYHTVDVKWDLFNFERNGMEKFFEKFMMVLRANFILFLLFMPIYYMVINSELEENTLSYDQVFCFSSILTLVSLLTIRLLANQSKFLTVNIRKLPPRKNLEEYVKERNEKTISHFHTLVCTTLMIFGIIISADLINKQIIFSLKAYDIEINSIYFVLCVYILALPIFTFIIELFLLLSPPIITIPPRDIEEPMYIEETQDDKITKVEKIKEDDENMGFPTTQITKITKTDDVSHRLKE